MNTHRHDAASHRAEPRLPLHTLPAVPVRSPRPQRQPEPLTMTTEEIRQLIHDMVG